MLFKVIIFILLIYVYLFYSNIFFKSFQSFIYFYIFQKFLFFGGKRVADRVLCLGGLRGHLDRFDGRRLRLLGQGVLCGGEVFSAVATSSTVAFLLAETSLAAG